MYVRILKNSNSITEILAQTIQHSFLVQVTQISNKVQSESKPLSYLTCLGVITKVRRKPILRNVTVQNKPIFQECLLLVIMAANSSIVRAVFIPTGLL